MEIKSINPIASLNASIQAPPSKAHSLRYIFLAALAFGKSRLSNLLLGEDQEYAISAIEQLGAECVLDREHKEVMITGNRGDFTSPTKELYVGNSGVTIRFLASICALAENGYTILTGNERMCKGRPIGELLVALGQLGVKTQEMAKPGYPPVKIFGGGLKGQEVTLSGGMSSQYLSAILIASPYAKKDVHIIRQGEFKSKPYLDITIEAMERFGVSVQSTAEGYHVKSGQHYKGCNLAVEGDFSSASYFFAAAAITGGQICVSGLNSNSKQGDKFFLTALEKMGCEVRIQKNKHDLNSDTVLVKGRKLRAITVNMTDYPDIVPSLAVVAAFADGISEFSGVSHLRVKESDRLKIIASGLTKLRIKVIEEPDKLIVHGGEMLGATIDPEDDHRMAMAFSIAGLKVPNIKISNPRCIKKSFPNFFEVLESLS